MITLMPLSTILRSWRYQGLPATSDDGLENTDTTPDEECKALRQTDSSVHQTRGRMWTLHLIWNIAFSCVNLVLALVLLLAIRRSRAVNGPIIQPLSDAIFGHIPVRPTTWQPDIAFTSTDPWDGAYWNNGSSSKGSTPWDTLFRSGWIAVDDPQAYGLSGGVPLRQLASEQFRNTWSDSAEGYNPTVIHQLHCVGILKHLLQVQVLADDNYTSGQAYGRLNALFEHGEHCIEYLRQSVMCAADLTLEPPQTINLATKSIHGTTGWNTIHQCRDWNVVHGRIWERLIRMYHTGERGAMVVVPDNA